MSDTTTPETALGLRPASPPVEPMQRSAPEFLGADSIIEAGHPEVVALARRLRAERPTDRTFARVAFEWVRDEVAHAGDARDPRVTLSASEVLQERVGLCFAKSHLLAALLRSEGIPTGLCYQRLRTPNGCYVLHGFVAVFLDGRWHRQDPRGNKAGVDAQFSLTGERLAWKVDPALGETDYPDVYASTAPPVVTALSVSARAFPIILPSDLG